jgi:uncharacterized membrane protein
MYLILKWLHILSAITAVGANATYFIWLRASTQDKASTRFALNGIERLEKLANPAYGSLLLTGIAMLFAGEIRWTTPWVISGIVLFIILGALGGMAYTPALKKQMALADKPDSAEYQAAQARGYRVGYLILLLAVIIEYLMTVKPTLWG